MNDWYRWDGPDLVLKLKLQPKSSRDAFAGCRTIESGRLKRARISAPEWFPDFLGPPRSV